METNELVSYDILYSPVNNMNFSEWLSNELIKRGWSQSELARKSGLTKGAIGNILREQRKHPQPDTIKAIARALGIPPERALQIAGILPMKKDGSPTVEEANYLLQTLPEDEQRRIVDYIRFIADKRAGYDASNIKKPLEPTD